MVAKKAAAPEPSDDPNQLVLITEDVIADLVHANTSRVGSQLIATAGTITTARRAAEMGIDPSQYRTVVGSLG